MDAVTLTPPKGLSDRLRIRRLYASAFPAPERKPLSLIFRLFRQKRVDIWCIRRGGRFCGFATTINSPDLILLDYLAICPKVRGTGVGTEALEQFLAKYPGKGVFIEIESTFHPGEDLPVKQKRKQFYLHCGMVPMNVTAEVFGVDMELLCHNCTLDFESYRSFYRDYYSPWAAEHVLPCKNKYQE